MPTYEYLCEKCDHEFEQFQSITARSLRRCPNCKQNGLKRLIGSGSGIIFKGSGFYQTDYRTENYKQAQKKEKSKSDTKKEKAQAKTKSKDASDSKPKAESTKKKKPG